GLEDQAVVGAGRMRELPHQARLAHAGFPDQGHQLTMPGACLLERPRQDVELSPTSNKSGEASRRDSLESGWHNGRADELVDLHRLDEPLHREPADESRTNVALGELQARAGQEY